MEWTRCDRGVAPKKILVFMPSGANLSLSDTYQGRVTMTTANSFTLRNVSMEDFGLYCCKIVYILGGVACALVLVVVVTTVIVCKKRRVQLRDYVNVSVHQGSVPKGQDDTGEEYIKGAEENDDDDDDEEDIDYQNVSVS
ncbi:hypothetical protein AALO_G00031360 [Alosa alosa]|uniref:Ig-like domain-containing protein n=1 Tax=Alosa alosa TaxID=278164 RepID=A0AAV6HCS1_9TELE|nr:hypothetical protein AALO_G00031360 [Alosa alosa]